MHLFLGKQFLFPQGSGLGIHDDPGLKIEYFFQFLEGEVKDITDPAGQTLKEPDMGHRCGQFYMAHSFPADLGLDDFHPAFLADDPAVLHPFVAAAKAFVILHRTEDLRTKQTVPFGLEGTIVDRFRLLDLPVGVRPGRPGKNLFRGGDGNLYGIEPDGVLRLFKVGEYVFHASAP